MATTEPFVHRARTKIVATVGPACNDVPTLLNLMAAGADVFRLNMAHGDHATHDRSIEAIRRAAFEAERPVGILVDLGGPKIRLGELHEDPTECRLGAELRFVRGTNAATPGELTSNYPRLIDELNKGDQVMLADGTVCLVVESRDADSARCRVVSAGQVRSRQGINLPGVKLSVPALTDEDRLDAAWAASVGVDFVGQSFVRSADDMHHLRQLLASRGSAALVVAKIEKREALERLDAIVDAADAVMVARGDLGVEIEVAQMPLAQKRIITACRARRKPVIVATQMLESMTHSRRPTRAEATDVANAVLDGADACMLSGETAVGQYPRETVETMNSILLATEELLRDAPQQPTPTTGPEVHPITSAVVYGAARIADRLDAKLVVVATRSGATALTKSKQRDYISTIGVSDSPITLRRMCLMWGITPMAGAPLEAGPDLRRYVDNWGRGEGVLAPGDRVVFVSGTGLVEGAHNLVVVHEVE